MATAQVRDSPVANWRIGGMIKTDSGTKLLRTPSTTAEISADPSPTARTSPPASTVNAAGFELDQVTALPSIR
jgi:hypothetical protein